MSKVQNITDRLMNELYDGISIKETITIEHDGEVYVKIVNDKDETVAYVPAAYCNLSPWQAEAAGHCITQGQS